MFRIKTPSGKKQRQKLQKERNPPELPKVEYMVNGFKKLPPYNPAGYTDKGLKIADPNSNRQKRLSSVKAKAKRSTAGASSRECSPEVPPTPPNGKRNFLPFYRME